MPAVIGAVIRELVADLPLPFAVLRPAPAVAGRRVRPPVPNNLPP